MNKQFFEKQMMRVINNYGPQHYSGGFKERSREIFMSFQRFQDKDFERIVDHILQTCKYPPKLAEFRESWKEVRRDGSKMYSSESTLLEYDPFFPDDDWIEKEIEKGKRANPGQDNDFVRALLQKVRFMAKENYNQFERMKNEQRARSNHNYHEKDSD